MCQVGLSDFDARRPRIEILCPELTMLFALGLSAMSQAQAGAYRTIHARFEFKYNERDRV